MLLRMLCIHIDVYHCGLLCEVHLRSISNYKDHRFKIHVILIKSYLLPSYQYFLLPSLQAKLIKYPPH